MLNVFFSQQFNTFAISYITNRGANEKDHKVVVFRVAATTLTLEKVGKMLKIKVVFTGNRATIILDIFPTFPRVKVVF